MSFSILGAVHNALAGALVNRTVSYSLGEYPARTPTNTLAGMQAYMIFQLSIFLECVLTLVFAAHLRGPFQTTLRRLGVSELAMYGLALGTVLPANLLAYGLLFGAGSLLELFPFSGYTPALNALVAITLALVTAASVLFLHMLFYSTAALVLLVAFPFLILLEEPDYPTIWTPLVVPTWLIRVFYAAFPPLGLAALCDLMVVLGSGRDSPLVTGQSTSVYGLELLFSDINGYYSRHFPCRVQQLPTRLGGR